MPSWLPPFYTVQDPSTGPPTFRVGLHTSPNLSMALPQKHGPETNLIQAMPGHLWPGDSRPCRVGNTKHQENQINVEMYSFDLVCVIPLMGQVLSLVLGAITRKKCESIPQEVENSLEGTLRNRDEATFGAVVA